MSALGYLQTELAALDARGLGRQERRSLGALAGVHSNDYLGLGHQEVRVSMNGDELCATAGSGASRLIGATPKAVWELEQDAARWLGAESAVTFSSGYAANLGVVQALGAIPGTELFSDENNHASLIDGCRLSGAPVHVYPHRDLWALTRALEGSSAAHCVVVSESYFSMDATSPDLPALRDICSHFNAVLVVDEAHAVGVFGPTGSGLCAAQGVKPDVLVAPLGKGLGLQGAIVAGPAVMRRWLWNKARTFLFSTGISPVLASIAREHLRRVAAADSERHHLAGLSESLHASLEGFHVKLPEGRHGPIFPLIVGTSANSLTLQRALANRGYYAPAIRPPSVPEGTARVRLTLNASLTRADLQQLTEAVRDAWMDLTTPAGS